MIMDKKIYKKEKCKFCDGKGEVVHQKYINTSTATTIPSKFELVNVHYECMDCSGKGFRLIEVEPKKKKKRKKDAKM